MEKVQKKSRWVLRFLFLVLALFLWRSPDYIRYLPLVNNLFRIAGFVMVFAFGLWLCLRLLNYPFSTPWLAELSSWITYLTFFFFVGVALFLFFSDLTYLQRGDQVEKEGATYYLIQEDRDDIGYGVFRQNSPLTVEEVYRTYDRFPRLFLN